MSEKYVGFRTARLSFKSFLIYMIIAGISVAVVSILFDIVFSTYKHIAGDPTITVDNFIKPFLSLLIDPLDSLLSGLLVYPIYRLIMCKYASLGLELFVEKENEDEK